MSKEFDYGIPPADPIRPSLQHNVTYGLAEPTTTHDVRVSKNKDGQDKENGGGSRCDHAHVKLSLRHKGCSYLREGTGPIVKCSECEW